MVGISLGGNILLKWLGETGQQSLIDAAVAVSVPFQLNTVVQKINKGFSRVYQTHLLERLRTLFTKIKHHQSSADTYETNITVHKNTV